MTAAVLARPRQVNVALMDDGGPVRALLSGVEGVALVAEAAAADVLVVPAVADIEAARQAVPGVAVLVVTACEDDESVFQAMRAGARGYLLESVQPGDLVRAIRGVAAGEMILGARIAARLTELMVRQAQPARHPFPDLTAREREILDLIAHGMDNAAIARRLCLAPKTVRNNLSTIFGKLGVTDRSAAAVLARKSGLGASLS